MPRPDMVAAVTALDRVTIDGTLDRLAAAWAARDADRVAALFAPDGVYAASVGPGPGTRAVGRAAIRDLAQRMFALDAGGASEVLERVPMPDGAFWRWRYTRPNGATTLGCDLVRVHGGLIVLKDAYRKVVA